MRHNLELPIEIKSLGNTGLFSGYASIFGFVDNQLDLVLPGAFENTLDDKNGGRDIKLLWQHDMAEPIGYFDKIAEDERGLYVQGCLLLDVQKGREAYSLMKAGAVSGLSIGYNTVQSNLDPQTGIRMIAELDLYEVSLVTFPANELAQVAEVKADDDYTQMELIKLSDALDGAIFEMSGY